MTKRRHVGQCPLSSANETWSPGQTAQRPRTRTSSMPAHWGYDLLRDAKDLLALVAAFELPPQRLRAFSRPKEYPHFRRGGGWRWLRGAGNRAVRLNCTRTLSDCLQSTAQGARILPFKGRVARLNLRNTVVQLTAQQWPTTSFPSRTGIKSRGASPKHHKGRPAPSVLSTAHLNRRAGQATRPPNEPGGVRDRRAAVAENRRGIGVGNP
jgi:hypothetical protein